MKRIKDRALPASQVRRPAPRIRIPERQPSLTKHRPVELEPRLELEHGVHQQPVERFVIAVRAGTEARLHQQDIGRAQNPAADNRLMKIDRQTARQDQSEPDRFPCPSHATRPPCAETGSQGSVQPTL